MEIEAIRVEVAKLAMTPGQILVVKCKSILSMNQREKIYETMQRIVPEDVKVWVIDHGIDICIVEPHNTALSRPGTGGLSD